MADHETPNDLAKQEYVTRQSAGTAVQTQSADLGPETVPAGTASGVAHTALTGLAEATENDWQSKVKAAQAESVNAQAAVDAAVAALAEAIELLASANAEGAKVRDELAAIPTRADAGPLLDQLEDARVSQRLAEAAILQAERDLALARAGLKRSALALRQAEDGRRRAQTEAAAAKRDAERVVALVGALNRPPLDTLTQDATDLLVSQIAVDAKIAAERGFPTVLLDRARDRVVIARERMKNVSASREAFAALVQAHVAASVSTEEKLAIPRAKHAAAVAALESYVTGAKQRFDRARGVLTRVAAQGSTLSDAQVERLNDPALTTAREAAAGRERVLDEARRDRELAEQERDLERARQAAGEPNDLPAKEMALADAVSAETAADANYDVGMRRTLSAWEAAAPDGAWADLAACDDAIEALKDLSKGPGNLDTEVTTTGANLASALDALQREKAARAVYEAELAVRTDEADFDAGAAKRIAFAALRGDA